LCFPAGCLVAGNSNLFSKCKDSEYSFLFLSDKQLIPKPCEMGRSRRHSRDNSGLRGNVLEGVKVTGIAAEGKAIARVGDKVLFIPYAAPGDMVDVLVMKSKSSYLEGVITHLRSPSPGRIQPFCKHFGTCGGCKWQHLPYETQLDFKHRQVTDSLERIGKVDLSEVEVLPILGAERTQFYRNKLEFTFSNRRWLTRDDIGSGEPIADMDALGFHVPGYFDKVLDIEKCWLQEEPSNEIRLAVKAFALEQGIPFYDLRNDTGLLRNLVIRLTPGGEVMVVLVLAGDEEAPRTAVLEFIRSKFPRVTTLAYVINDKKNSSLSDLEPVIYHGRPYMVEEMDGLQFRIGPNSFFQTNSLQAKALYEAALGFADLQGHELVYDLYTGTGTIAIFVARHARRVVGIEYVEEAVAHARENAALNGLVNTEFFAGDMAGILDEVFMQRHGYPHVVITDPPRAGMHPKVVKQLLNTGADRIVYVSCNPATQARDIEMLSPRYRLSRVRAVDMFPHTHHVESVALLHRR
jgi:23S rRNA (uracil1939-C5)-methyltransferase